MNSNIEDNGQFRQAFIEETLDLLGQLEDVLLSLEDAPGELQYIDSVFRTIHTIKGSAGMFGFMEISHFSHTLENFLDAARKQQVQMERSDIGILLSARDLILQYLGGELTRSDFDLRQADLIKQLIPSESAEAVSGESTSVAASATDASATEASTTQTGDDIRAEFYPDAGFFRRGMDPLDCFQELRESGDVEIHLNAARLLPLSQASVEDCLLSWQLVLPKSDGNLRLDDTFMFAGQPPSRLEIADLPGPAPATQASIEPKPSEEETFKPALASKANSSAFVSGDMVKIPAERLDALIAMAGETVSLHSRLNQGMLRGDTSGVIAELEQLERVSARLRDAALRLRMKPVAGLFTRFRRLVRDLAADLDKNIQFICDGEDTELDTGVIEAIQEPLLHLLRNAVDHGIESPDERAALGKDPVSRLELTATAGGSLAEISIIDDGRGIDHDAILTKAMALGIYAQGEQPNESSLMDLLFRPGFSTARKISDISGRGVGLDVVKRNVERVGGSLMVDSQLGRGTEFRLRVPLTLALIEVLIIAVSGQRFAVALAGIEDCRDPDSSDSNLAAWIDLPSVLELPDVGGEQTEIIYNIHGRRIALICSEARSREQIVLNSLGPLYRDVRWISGASIMADGSIVPVLDIAGLWELHRSAGGVIDD